MTSTTLQRFLLATVAGLLFLAPACQQQPPQAPDTRAADEQALRDLENDWSKVAAAKDLDRFLGFYADDASVFEPNQPVKTGKEAIRADLTKFLATPGLTMNFQTVKVEVARSGDIAYTYGTYTSSKTGPKGKPVEDKGKYVTVYKKQPDGKWKAVADIDNSDLPAPSK